jgi:hypothetical protein
MRRIIKKIYQLTLNLDAENVSNISTFCQRIIKGFIYFLIISHASNTIFKLLGGINEGQILLDPRIKEIKSRNSAWTSIKQRVLLNSRCVFDEMLGGMQRA